MGGGKTVAACNSDQSSTDNMIDCLNMHHMTSLFRIYAAEGRCQKGGTTLEGVFAVFAVFAAFVTTHNRTKCTQQYCSKHSVTEAASAVLSLVEFISSTNDYLPLHPACTGWTCHAT